MHATGCRASVGNGVLAVKITERTYHEAGPQALHPEERAAARVLERPEGRAGAARYPRPGAGIGRVRDPEGRDLRPPLHRLAGPGHRPQNWQAGLRRLAGKLTRPDEAEAGSAGKQLPAEPGNSGPCRVGPGRQPGDSGLQQSLGRLSPAHDKPFAPRAGATQTPAGSRPFSRLT